MAWNAVGIHGAAWPPAGRRPVEGETIVPGQLRHRKALLERRLLVSDSPQGRLRFGLPLHVLRFHFPALWPEVEAGDGDSGAGAAV